MTWDVLVLGAGGMGAAALAHLAGRGLRAIGIEQDDVPSLRGSSVGHTRIIRKAYFEDERYVPLLHRAYALWNELDPSLYVRTGCLNLGPATHPDIAGVLASVRTHGLAHELLDAAAVAERFPAFQPAPDDVGVYEADAGYLRVEACTAAHAALATRRGATLRTRTKIERLRLGDTIAATLDSGEEVVAKHLVVAAGPWLPRLDLAAGLPPLTVTRQVQLWFRPRQEDIARAPAMPAFIHFTGDRAYYGLPLADDGTGGVKVCRHHGGEATTPETIDRALRPDDVADVESYVRAHLVNAAGPVVHSQVCMYTSTPDHHFVIGRHPRHANVVVLGGFSGHGYKMASVVGEIAADLVEHGKSRLDIGLFDPARAIETA